MSLSKPIPGFSVPNRSEKNYDRYYHTRCLIQSHSANFPDFYKNPEGSRYLCEALGRKNLSKFMRRRKDWDNLNVPIPKEYIDLLGLKLKDIQNAIAFDQEYFDEMLKTTTTYKESYLTYRWVIGRIRFPHPLTEAEAIEYSRQELLKVKAFKQVLINRMPLYQIYVTRDNVYYHYNRPDFTYNGKQYQFVRQNLPGLYLK